MNLLCFSLCHPIFAKLINFIILLMIITEERKGKRLSFVISHNRPFRMLITFPLAVVTLDSSLSIKLVFRIDKAQ
jgi:hypothetical protein